MKTENMVYPPADSILYYTVVLRKKSTRRKEWRYKGGRWLQVGPALSEYGSSEFLDNSQIFL